MHYNTGVSETIIYHAANAGNAAIVKALIDAGADVNVPSMATAVTPLREAARLNDPAMVRMLLDAGADVNAQDNRRKTPLIWAVPFYGSPKLAIVRALLDAGADVNALDIDHNTALLDVLTYPDADLDVVMALLDAGADVNVVRRFDKGTALHNAAGHGEWRIAEPLIARGAHLDAQDSKGNTPLHNAVEACFLGKSPTQVIRLIVSHGGNLKIKSKDEYTALYVAAKGGLYTDHHGTTNDALKALVIANADVNLAAGAGSTLPPYRCVSWSHRRRRAFVVSWRGCWREIG